MERRVARRVDGKVTLERAGAVDERHEVVRDVLSDDSLCAVNLYLGATIALPNYSNVKCGVSLTVPVVKEELESGYRFAKEWCERKMEELTLEVQGYSVVNRGGERGADDPGPD